MTEDQQSSYASADMAQKFAFLIDASTQQDERFARLTDLMEERATRLNQIGLRLDVMGTRIEGLETHVNPLLLSHNTEEASKAELQRWQKTVMSLLMATASLALGSISIAIAVLLALLTHVVR